MLCYVTRGIDCWQITIVRLFSLPCFELLSAQPVQSDKDLQEGAMDSVQGQPKTKVLHAWGNGANSHDGFGFDDPNDIGEQVLALSKGLVV